MPESSQAKNAMTLDLSPFKFEVVSVDAQGQPGDRQQSSANHQLKDLGQDVELEMVAIPGGSFQMGAPETEEGWSGAQGPQHSVTIQPFLIGKYPVTQAQWQAVAALPKVNQSLDPDPASGKGADSPVEQVTWEDAVEFCQRFSANGASLPAPQRSRVGICLPSRNPDTFSLWRNDHHRFSQLFWD